jgi:hypothetical protein
MIKLVEISHLSTPDYVAQALEGSYGLDGRKNIYFTGVKGLVFVNAVGPLSIDEKLPQNAFDWHLVVCSDTGVRTVPVRNSQLTFTLAEGETAQGSFRIRA